MHRNNQLSQKDMYILNKFMMNKLANIIYMIKVNKSSEFFALMNYYDNYASHWDEATPNEEEINSIIELFS